MKTFTIFAAAVFSAALLAFGGETNSAPAPNFYHIRNSKFDLLLRPENANNADGTRIVLYSAEPWKCMTWKLRPAANDSFELQNYFTGKTFTAKTNGALVQIPLGKEASERPTWKFLKLANGFYEITDAKSEKVLTGSQNGVTLAPWAEKPEQEWELMATDPSKLTM